MNLHVSRRGDDATLLLHGVAGSSATYDWLDCGVRFDFRGHGASSRAPGTYVLDGYVEDAIAVLEDFGPMALAGHSLGGVVAWTVAQRRPELVRAAFLEDPPLYMGEPAEHARSTAIPRFHELRAFAARWQAEGTDEATAAAELASENAEAGAPDSFAARAYALLHLDLEVLDRVIDGSLLFATDTASPVAAPVLVLAAGVDPAFTVAHEARLARTHPEVRVVRLAGAGHSIHDEAAHRGTYRAQLETFLSANTSR